MLPVDSLLLSSRAPIGLLAINKIPVCTNQGFKSLIPSKEVSVEYLYHVLKANVSRLQARGNGATFKELAKPAVETFEIPLPTLDDQIRIAHLLGKVDGLIAHRKQHLQQLDDLLKSVFLEMFGDPIVNPRGFPVRRLSEFYISPKEGTKCGPFGSALKKVELVEAGVPVWNMDNIGPDGQMVLPFRMWITPKKYDDLSAYSVQDGDIIISRAGTVGKMCVARMHGQPAIISTNLIRVRLGSELRPLHFVFLMLYCKGRVGRLKTGADGAFTHMNTGVLDSLEFPYPAIELQNRFAVIVEKVEGIKSRYQQSLTDLEVLYDALSQKAFKGDLDLSRISLPKNATQLMPTDASMQIAEVITSTEHVRQLVQSTEPQGRDELLARWFQQYLANTPPATGLRAAEMLEGAWQALQTAQLEVEVSGEEKEEEEEELPDLADYDVLKALAFKALDAGELLQTFDDDRNRVALAKPSADWGAW